MTDTGIQSEGRLRIPTQVAIVVVRMGMVGLLLAACGSDGSSSEQTLAVASSAAPTTTRPPESTSPPTTQPTVSSPPPTTAGSTLPPGPPVFDRQAIGDNLTLASFVLTVTVANTNNGQLNETVTTTGFINEPRSVYELATFSYDGTSDGLRKYLVGGRAYEENQFGDWYLYEAGNAATPDYTDRLDVRHTGTLAAVLSAELADQSEYEGIPANHFVFDETDLASYASYTPENPAPAVEGDFYLAQEGNHVLYTHSKETSPGRIYEVTEALSSISQVVDIALPSDLSPMTEALDTGVALKSVLPPDASLSSMIRYAHGIGVDYYKYETPARNNDEFLSFYRTLAPTDGWTVSHIGHIRPHLEDVDCETSVECVILNSGGDQIVVSFAGSITVEYDREHVFSPL